MSRKTGKGNCAGTKPMCCMSHSLHFPSSFQPVGKRKKKKKKSKKLGRKQNEIFICVENLNVVRQQQSLLKFTFGALFCLMVTTELYITSTSFSVYDIYIRKEKLLNHFMLFYI